MRTRGGSTLDFEAPYVELEKKAEELRRLEDDGVDFSREIKRLEGKAARLRRQIFRKLDASQRRALARHDQRPRASDVARALLEELFLLSGDRQGGDDPAIIAALGWLDRRAVAIVGVDRSVQGVQGGATIGLRKARRLFDLARRFALPVICLIDGPERGQEVSPGRVFGDAAVEAQAAASCLGALVASPEPTVALVIGELASIEGAALVACDRVLMLEHAVAAAAPAPEIATRLWGDVAEVAAAARASQLDAAALVDAGIVDEVISEPPGGAHRDIDAALGRIVAALKRVVEELAGMSAPVRRDERQRRIERAGGGR